MERTFIRPRIIGHPDLFIYVFAAFLFAGCQEQQSQTVIHNVIETDVIVYGGTSAAVTTAVQISRMGKTVVVVSPDTHLGGLTSGGLGYTDTGKKEAIGGLAREFYHRVWKHYQNDDAWVWREDLNMGTRGRVPQP